MKTLRLWALSTAVALLAAVGVAVTSPTAHAAVACSVTYTKDWDNGGGFGASITINNLGDPVSPWTLRYTWPGNQQVTQGWGGTWTQSGQSVTVTAPSYAQGLGNGSRRHRRLQRQLQRCQHQPHLFRPQRRHLHRQRTPDRPTAHRDPATRPPPPRPPPPAGNAMAAVAAMQPGWNLGNSFDATGADETVVGQPAGHRGAARQRQGAGLQQHPDPGDLGPAPGRRRRTTPSTRRYLNRVKEVVDWALADGFYVMINVHHDSWQWINNMPTDHDERARPVQRDLDPDRRPRSADSSPKLVFESVNEPQFTGSSGDAQNAHAAERAEHVVPPHRARLRRQQRHPAAGPADPAHLGRPGPDRRAGQHVQRAERPQPHRDGALLRLLAVQRQHRRRHPLRRHRPAGPDRRLRPGATTPSSPRASR